MNDDYIVSFLKNTDVENIKKMGTIPEEHAVPPSQIAKKNKAPKAIKKTKNDFVSIKHPLRLQHGLCHKLR